MLGEPRAYEIPFRPPHEFVAAAGWLFAAVGTFVVLFITPFPKYPFRYAMALILMMMFIRFVQGWNRYEERKSLQKGGLTFTTHEQLHAKLTPEDVGKSIWIGTGFDWDSDCVARTHEIMSRGPENVVGKTMTAGGAHYLHAVAIEKNQNYLQQYREGHTAILGTTGSGKTRLLDILITQLAACGVKSIHPNSNSKRQAIIIIDPKGDKGLYENAKKLCEDAGEPERFVYFNPAFPEKSACIDVMRNFNAVTELATRITTIMPSETGNDPFVAFAWKTMNDINAGLQMCGERTSLVKLRRYIEAGVSGLLERCLRTHFERNIDNWQATAQQYEQKHKGSKVDGMVAYYQQVASREFPSTVIDGLVNAHNHERTHYQKMTASLIPILTMLTAGHLSDLLSPDPMKITDRTVTDMASIIREGKVCYIALNSLADGTVGSAVGSLLLSDVTAVAGDRYNYDIDPGIEVNLFIDELGEVVNAPAIQLLNKGRGAGIRVCVAMQTIADLVVRLGSEFSARKVLGNINNLYVLRLHDNETRDYVVEKAAKVSIPIFNYSYRSGNDSDHPGKVAGGYMEGIKDEEVDRIAPRSLNELPNLHYFAMLADGRLIKSRIPVLVSELPKAA